MSPQTQTIVLIILVLVLLLVIAVTFSNYMMKKAILSVIKTFRDKNALKPENARTEEELGFKRRQSLDIKLVRDYNPIVFQFLLKKDIVRITEEGKLYLSEEALFQSGLDRFLK